MLLWEIIKLRIENEGPISFRDFMEMALYYPELGYYNTPKNIIGRKGDFYTSPDLTPAFGAMIARQIEEMWHFTGEENFTIVEFGAGTGVLCRDILDYLEKNEKLFEGLSYCIIEKGTAMKQRQQNHLRKKVRWVNSISELPPFTGCIISNELLDNFAVHQVVKQHELMEVFVNYKDGFIEELRPADTLLKEYFTELGISLQQGFRTEINLQACGWLKEIAAALKKGYVITIDYGGGSEELYSERRKRGTVVCYNNHRVNEEPYQNIGAQDITAHVNFSALSHWGAKNGLALCGLTSQASFLLSLGFKEHLLITIPQDTDIMKMIKQQAFITHTLLVDMGQKFKVLLQRKGIDERPLKGLTLSATVQHF